MNKVYIGKIVNTHGIKGELRIRSDFPYKDRVFVKGNNLIIDDKEYNIKSYRKHKTFDMVFLGDYHDINEVLFLVGKKVYFDRDLLQLNDNEITDEELICYKVITNDGRSGIILEIFSTGRNNKLIRIKLDKEILVPYNEEFISIDKSNKTITVNLIDGM